MDKLKLLVIDVETNGLDDDCELVEFAGVPVNVNKTPDEPLDRGDIEILDGQSSLACPVKPVPPEVMAIHHITNEALAGQPSAGRAVKNVVHGIGNGEPDYYVAHNSRFDEKYVKGLLPADGPWIDTYRVALALFPDAKSHKNAALFYMLNLHLDPSRDWPEFFSTNQLHRALPDAVLTAYVLREMMTRMSLSQMAEISRHPAILPRVGFGKHFGKKWSEVDKGYLKWLINNGDFEEDVMHTARTELLNR